MCCTMSLHATTTWRRTAVTERSLRDAARMGWRWNRQLHPRQLKGTSSRTRIIAGVLLSAYQGPTTLYERIVYCCPQLGCEGVPAPSRPLCSCMSPPAQRIELVGWRVASEVYLRSADSPPTQQTRHRLPNTTWMQVTTRDS
jgi:hypothetical protein